MACLAHEHRGTSPSLSLKMSTKPVEGFDRFSRLYDDQFHIRPWGFLNKAVEKKFVEYHWLTFMTNYKSLMARLWGSMAVLYSIYCANHLCYEEAFFAALSLFRCAVCLAMAVLFSGHFHVRMGCIREFYRLISWGCFVCVVPFCFAAEFVNPATSQVKVTLNSIMGSFIAFLMLQPSWFQLSWAYCMSFLLPAAIIFLSTWEQHDHEKMMERAMVLAFAGAGGHFFAALFSVDYRRQWAIASVRESRRTKKAAHKLLPNLAEDDDPRSLVKAAAVHHDGGGAEEEQNLKPAGAGFEHSVDSQDSIASTTSQRERSSGTNVIGSTGHSNLDLDLDHDGHHDHDHDHDQDEEDDGFGCDGVRMGMDNDSASTLSTFASLRYACASAASYACSSVASSAYTASSSTSTFLPEHTERFGWESSFSSSFGMSLSFGTASLDAFDPASRSAGAQALPTIA